MQLARALIAAGRTAEAESHLRTLWAAAPGNGTVNLALARLAAQSNRIDDAIRYYHAAIDGSWPSAPLVSRRDTQFELARMLLDQQRPTQARSELILLADAVRDDPDQTLLVARMLVQAGDARTALTLANRVIADRPTDLEALTLAADLQFQNANYVEARDLLRRASRAGSLPVAAQSELRDASAVLALDPAGPRLGSITRQGRIRRVLMILRQRLNACLMPASGAPSPDLAALQARLMDAEKTAVKTRRADADELDEVMALTGAIEQLPDSACGPSAPDDRTLRLIARAHPAS
jgi:predicted Zn-dependent protease